MTVETWKPLEVVILGGGLGGLSCGIALRNNGHKVRIYERYDYAGEVGASLSCASNGGRWLHDWGIDPLDSKPVILKRLIKHNWNTGNITDEYDLGDYAAKFGFPYYNFHRIDLHTVLMDKATSSEGKGEPCELILNHKAVNIDYEKGHIVFENGEETSADLIVAADGIRSLTREQLGLVPNFKLADSSCIRVLFDTEKVRSKGLQDFSTNDAIEFWGGENKYKIVLSPCSNNEVVSCYCFFDAGKEDLDSGWNNTVSIEKLNASLPNLDPNLKRLFIECGYDIKQWRLYIHQPLPFFYNTSQDGLKGTVLLGDAAHPMMPDQSQGAVSAFEDSGALGYIFSKKFNLTVKQGLKIYELVRKPRVTKIQAASLRARENLNERIGWSTNSLKDVNKLTIEEVCGYDMKSHIDGLIEKEKF
ncbi:uncharacterized protein PRCAT00004336001 [Priceomyces carsonii]|uniref:uncharacterized protein n=1 Tax=Priceomyces carsonii TaxID=28549 RepID=UPI002ED7E27E|nr:unnamed protein product [Priceomyces carsonii]